ncbi:MAG TPA: NAD(P)-binding domain-containing protein, partial [Polyangiaceae bacterium]|nr:NAD(P)-binding domain-containing protein [Polyangiaceae bacterium]
MTDPDGQKGADSSDKRARIAILGYGAKARDRAVRLRQAGHEVSVSMRPGGLSWVRATADKFAPAPPDEAVASAEVVVLLVPDEEQPSVYWRVVEPNISSGALLVV